MPTPTIWSIPQINGITILQEGTEALLATALKAAQDQGAVVLILPGYPTGILQDHLNGTFKAVTVTPEPLP